MYRYRKNIQVYEARKCGADAIIIQNHMGHMNRDEVVMLGITAIAIRYQDN